MVSVEVGIIGAGPAGLMAAQVLGAAGIQVRVFDAMPTPGRKFLMAGRGGLNLTHSEDPSLFMSRFRQTRFSRQSEKLTQPPMLLLEALSQCPPEAVRAWADDLGAQTFVGSSGRVFPKVMKAAPLLRAWLHRLGEQGVTLSLRHRWIAWGDPPGVMHFSALDGPLAVHASCWILALGGCSWPRLGATGDWQDLLSAKGVGIEPFRPTNCGFEVAWGDFLTQQFAGQPLKNIMLRHVCPDGRVVEKRGDLMITRHGVEGGAVYALSADLRETLDQLGSVTLTIDLLPDRGIDEVRKTLATPRGSRSWANFLQNHLNFGALHRALLHECLTKSVWEKTDQLAAALKALPVVLTGTRPIEEAISVAGGVSFQALGEGFQLNACPGVFCVGEMLDWEAPTGGYLLTACLATGRAAAVKILDVLKSN